MKKLLALTLALFCAGLFVKPVHAADIGTEFGVADDLGVYGTGGTAADPDVKIKGFTVFGATQAAPALNIPAAPGNIFINGYLQVSSGMYVAAYSTFSAGMYVSGESTFTARINLPAPGSIFLPDGTAGQILRKKADGSLEWGAAAVTGSGTQYKIPLWNNAGGTQLGDSLLVQDSAGTYVYIGGATLFKVTAANGNTLIGGTLDVTGATALGGALGVTGASTLNGNVSVSGANTFTVGTGATALGGTLGVTGASTLNGNVSISGANTFTVGTGATALGGALGVTGASTLNGNVSVSGANTFTVGTGATALGGALNVTGVVTASQFGVANTDIHGVNQAAEAGTALAVKGTDTSTQYITKFYSNTSLAAWLRNK